jgi:hypothetical protein
MIENNVVIKTSCHVLAFPTKKLNIFLQQKWYKELLTTACIYNFSVMSHLSTEYIIVDKYNQVMNHVTKIKWSCLILDSGFDG